MLKPMSRHLTLFLSLAIGLGACNQALAARQQPLSASASDPAKMGWMQGFPPANGRTLSAADGSFFEFPALRWSVAHMREFLPTTRVSRGLGAPEKLDYALDDAIDSLTFMPWGQHKPISWEQSLQQNYTDGIIVLHRGRVVYERYLGELSQARQHAAMSVTKSFTGTLAAMLVAQERLNPDARVTEHIPELAHSAFGDASVRQVMNMTTSLQYSEDYADPNAEIWAYA